MQISAEIQTHNLSNMSLLIPWPLDQSFLPNLCKKAFMKRKLTCGQYYKASTIINYDSRVVPDLKIPHITTLES